MTAPPAAVELRDRPGSAKDWLIYVFRKLFRADFCFIVPALAAVDAVAPLLALVARGAQAHWIGQLFAGGKDYHA